MTIDPDIPMEGKDAKYAVINTAVDPADGHVYPLQIDRATGALITSATLVGDVNANLKPPGAATADEDSVAIWGQKSDLAYKQIQIDDSGNLKITDADLPDTPYYANKTTTGAAEAFSVPSQAVKKGCTVRSKVGNTGIYSFGAVGNLPLMPGESTFIQCNNMSVVSGVVEISGDTIYVMGV